MSGEEGREGERGDWKEINGKLERENEHRKREEERERERTRNAERERRRRDGLCAYWRW